MHSLRVHDLFDKLGNVSHLFQDFPDKLADHADLICFIPLYSIYQYDAIQLINQSDSHKAGSYNWMKSTKQ